MEYIFLILLFSLINTASFVAVVNGKECVDMGTIDMDRLCAASDISPRSKNRIKSIEQCHYDRPSDRPCFLCVRICQERYHLPHTPYPRWYGNGESGYTLSYHCGTSIWEDKHSAWSINLHIKDWISKTNFPNFGNHWQIPFSESGAQSPPDPENVDYFSVSGDAEDDPTTVYFIAHTLDREYRYSLDLGSGVFGNACQKKLDVKEEIRLAAAAAAGVYNFDTGSQFVMEDVNMCRGMERTKLVEVVKTSAAAGVYEMNFEYRGAGKYTILSFRGDFELSEFDNGIEFPRTTFSCETESLEVNRISYDQYMQVRDEVWEPLLKNDAHRIKEGNIIVTGHSFGGAMAHLFMLDLLCTYYNGQNKREGYHGTHSDERDGWNRERWPNKNILPTFITFGSPRVFTSDTASLFNDLLDAYNLGLASRMKRIFNPQDPFVNFPPEQQGFKHVGEPLEATFKCFSSQISDLESRAYGCNNILRYMQASEVESDICEWEFDVEEVLLTARRLAVSAADEVYSFNGIGSSKEFSTCPAIKHISLVEESYRLTDAQFAIYEINAADNPLNQHRKTENDYFAKQAPKKAIIISFRGTEFALDGLMDLIVDITGNPVIFPHCQGLLHGLQKLLLVHHGFLLQYSALRSDLFSFIERRLDLFDSRNSDLIVTGHSLGAALANLFSIEFQCKYQWNPEISITPHVITFSSPPSVFPWTKDYLEHIQSPLQLRYFQRVYNRGDPVESVPGLISLSHIGTPYPRITDCKKIDGYIFNLDCHMNKLNIQEARRALLSYNSESTDKVCGKLPEETTAKIDIVLENEDAFATPLQDLIQRTKEAMGELYENPKVSIYVGDTMMIDFERPPSDAEIVQFIQSLRNRGACPKNPAVTFCHIFSPEDSERRQLGESSLQRNTKFILKLNSKISKDSDMTTSPLFFGINSAAINELVQLAAGDSGLAVGSAPYRPPGGAKTIMTVESGSNKHAETISESKGTIVEQITKDLGLKENSFKVSITLSSSNAVCGNHETEFGEECEGDQRSSSCCNAMTCKLIKNAACAPSSASDCCNEYCQYKASETPCGYYQDEGCERTCTGSDGTCPDPNLGLSCKLDPWIYYTEDKYGHCATGWCQMCEDLSNSACTVDGCEVAHLPDLRFRMCVSKAYKASWTCSNYYLPKTCNNNPSRVSDGPCAFSEGKCVSVSSLRCEDRKSARLCVGNCEMKLTPQNPKKKQCVSAETVALWKCSDYPNPGLCNTDKSDVSDGPCGFYENKCRPLAEVPCHGRINQNQCNVGASCMYTFKPNQRAKGSKRKQNAKSCVSAAQASQWKCEDYIGKQNCMQDQAKVSDGPCFLNEYTCQSASSLPCEQLPKSTCLQSTNRCDFRVPPDSKHPKCFDKETVSNWKCKNYSSQKYCGLDLSKAVDGPCFMFEGNCKSISSMPCSDLTASICKTKASHCAYALAPGDSTLQCMSAAEVANFECTQFDESSCKLATGGKGKCNWNEQACIPVSEVPCSSLNKKKHLCIAHPDCKYQRKGKKCIKRS